MFFTILNHPFIDNIIVVFSYILDYWKNCFAYVQAVKLTILPLTKTVNTARVNHKYYVFFARSRQMSFFKRV